VNRQRDSQNLPPSANPFKVTTNSSKVLFNSFKLFRNYGDVDLILPKRCSRTVCNVIYTFVYFVWLFI
jgi:hypothetical protein